MHVTVDEKNALDAYQDTTHDTAVYPRTHALGYLSLGLLAEANEFVQAEDALRAFDELGDIMWFVSELANLESLRLSELVVTSTYLPPIASDVDGAGYIVSFLAEASGAMAKHLRDGTRYRNELADLLAKTTLTAMSIVDILSSSTEKSFIDLLQENRNKLLSRQSRGKLRGSGDHR